MRPTALALLLWATPALAEDWTQFVGPRGDFTTDAGALAEAWPESGPPRLWSRSLGAGYSSVLHRDGRLYTMYRTGQDDVLVALDAASGETIWEHRHRYGLWEDMYEGFGLGPNSTPILVGDRLVGIGIGGHVRAVDAATGEPIWGRDLPADYGRRKRDEEYGYSGNPVAFGGAILVPVGGETAAVVALDPRDGTTRWQSAPGGVSYAAPLVTRLAGRDQYLYFEPEGVVALDPATGTTLWKHAIEYNNGNHLTPAVKCDDEHLWISSQFDSGGGRLLRVRENTDGFEVRELWFTPQLQTSHWPLHRRGEFVYGSIGGNSSSRLAAVHWLTGEVAWREHGFHKAQALWADGKLLFLDEDGQLTLARVSPERLEVLATAQVATPRAWTLPTLVDTTLYVRDQEKILALDLGRVAGR